MNDALITFLTVTDLDRSSAFYGGALDLPLAADQGTCRIYRVAQGGFVGICEAGQRTVSRSGVILTLVRDDVDEFCARLADAGVTFEKEPTHNDQFGIYHAFLRDPDGHLIEIQRFDDPSWSEAGR